MTPWRLERIRLFRTLRWVAVVAPYVVFGVAMPIVTRYQEALYRNLGGDVRVIAPEPTPAQAIAAYTQNATQLGLIVSVLVVAGSLVFDARPEWAMFLRTRTTSLAEVVVPKVVTNAVVVAVAFSIGSVTAWCLARALIGPVPMAALVGGTVAGGLYFAFIVAVVAFAAGVTRSVLAAAGVTIGVLIVLPLVGRLAFAERWVPSALVGVPTALAEGEAVTAYVPAAGVSVVISVALVWLSIGLLERREV